MIADQWTPHQAWLNSWLDLAETRHDSVTQNYITQCKPNTTPVGFEPTRGDPIGLAGRRLNRSAKVSVKAWCCRQSTAASAERALVIIHLISPWASIQLCLSQTTSIDEVLVLVAERQKTVKSSENERGAPRERDPMTMSTLESCFLRVISDV